MQLVLTEWYRKWRGAEPQKIQPTVLPLDNERALFGLLVMLGNGEYDDLCIESDSAEALKSARELLLGTGGAERAHDHPLANSSPLYRPGYEIYVQADQSVFFLNPEPRPALFQSDMAAYIEEFGSPLDLPK